MRLFHSYLLFFIFSLPLIYWYIRKSGQFSDLFTVPRLISYLSLGYMFCTVALYIWVPTYREHIEPSITTISLMIADGYPAYTQFDDSNVYSILYGPTTYLFQSEFLKLFSNPILGSKVYGALCFVIGFAVLSYFLIRKYGVRYSLQGLFYFSIFVLLYYQVAYRNQSDSIIFLGSSLAVASLLSPSKWTSRLLLAFGVALSVSAKFHAVGYVLPLLYFFYRQHGVKQLIVIGIASAALALSPFLLETYSLSNFLTTMQAYSKLKLHYWLFLHNLSMAYVIFLPLLLLIYTDLRNKKIKPLLSNESFWTFLFTNAMMILVCLTAGIDGAGSYHIAPFAPVVAVLYTIYYSRHRDEFQHQFSSRGITYKTLLMTGMVAWCLAISVFTVSVQKKYIWFIQDHSSRAIETEVLLIKKEIEKNNWRVLMGYSSEEGYQKTYYRPLLWSAIKDNSMDPIAMMGRRAVGVPIPEIGVNRIAKKYYDIVIIPKPGKPFSMYNWHDTQQSVYGDDLPKLFDQNYSPLKEYEHFVLWQAKPN